jgi:hypothetical protein
VKIEYYENTGWSALLSGSCVRGRSRITEAAELARASDIAEPWELPVKDTTGHHSPFRAIRKP